MHKIDPTDLLGKVFTRLTVEEVGPDYLPDTAVDRVSRAKRHTRYWCLCTCGVRKLIRRDSLLKGNSKSCGCLAEDQHTLQMGLQSERSSRAPRFGHAMSDRRAARVANDF
jgi:hypothetical protein